MKSSTHNLAVQVQACIRHKIDKWMPCRSATTAPVPWKASTCKPCTAEVEIQQYLSAETGFMDAHRYRAFLGTSKCKLSIWVELQSATSVRQPNQRPQQTSAVSPLQSSIPVS